MKLQGFSPLFCINLDRHPERWQRFEVNARDAGIESWTRFSGIDAKLGLNDLIYGRYPSEITDPNIACTLSHLSVIKLWLESDQESEYAIICEDDVDFSTNDYWPFTWKEVTQRFPYNWDLVQLAIINPKTLYANLHPRLHTDYSTAAYVITRRYANKLMELHAVGRQFRLDNCRVPWPPVADALIYNAGVCYAMPLFTYDMDAGSTIQTVDHVERFHRKSHDDMIDFWKNQAKLMPIDSFFSYDPFMERA